MYPAGICLMFNSIPHVNFVCRPRVHIYGFMSIRFGFVRFDKSRVDSSCLMESHEWIAEVVLIPVTFLKLTCAPVVFL
jgi:hypothetical protein